MPQISYRLMPKLPEFSSRVSVFRPGSYQAKLARRAGGKAELRSRYCRDVVAVHPAGVMAVLDGTPRLPAGAGHDHATGIMGEAVEDLGPCTGSGPEVQPVVGAHLHDTVLGTDFDRVGGGRGPGREW